jgi:sugar/nucleoside kinase (ribokinase family)
MSVKKMSVKKIVVSGTGCCFVDRLFTGIDFGNNNFRPYLSKVKGDGGLTPGHLVFDEQFEEFCNAPLDSVLNKISGGRNHVKLNIGGPSIVSLINAAQLTGREVCEVRFFGKGGNDEAGSYLLSSLKKTPVILHECKLIDKQTPFMVVLSDPDFNEGKGERIFIYSIGATTDYASTDLPDVFFESDIIVFGGTALTPRIHDNLTSLLKKAKSRKCYTIVNTVFDFRNEKIFPWKRWPLGDSDESYAYTDLIISNKEEALRLSGTGDPEAASCFFREKGVSSFIITDGANDITAYSDGRFFSNSGYFKMPVSKKIKDELKYPHEGDSTGCGGNFAGGVIASILMQLTKGLTPPNLEEACCWGIVSGGFTCFYLGGTYFERSPGEKLSIMEGYYESYRKQLLGIG